MPKTIDDTEVYSGVEKRSRLLSALEIAAIAGGIVLSAACTPEVTNSKPAITNTTSPHEAPSLASTAILSPEQKRQRAKAQEYIKSEDRNSSIGKAVQAAGEKIVHAAASGKIGKFTFINFRTGEWGLGANNAGWGRLHHNPIDGGKQISISMTVYQNANGTIDLEKGILELKLGSVAGPSYTHFESPSYGRVILDESKDDDAWQVARTPGRIGSMLGDTEISNELECVNSQTEKLLEIDQKSINDLYSIMMQADMQLAA